METERCDIYGTVELRIKDFCTATEELDINQLVHRDEPYDFRLGASVYPNGVNENTEGWVVVISYLIDIQRRIDRKESYLNWTVSIVDIEGNLRFPQSFQRSYPADDFTAAKYSEKSFILSREDELLSEGVLLLRCDIYFDFKIAKRIRTWKIGIGDNPEDFFSNIFRFRPPAVCFKNGKETGYNIGFFKAFESPCEDLTLRKFQESGKSSDVDLIYDVMSSPSSVSKENSAENLEDAWKFDTCSDRFRLSLKESVGARLVQSSPVIAQCINAPMKEKQRIEMSTVATKTFKSVLFFLESGVILNENLDETAEVYKFSHLYDMEKLREKCAEHMVKMIKTPIDWEEMEKMADFYSDEYLLRLLDSHLREYCNFPTHIINDRPDSNSYI